MQQLNPILATQRIHQSYARYLQTLYPIADAELQQQFRQMLADKQKLVKGPYLEATPPYQTTGNIHDLMKQGVLSPLFSALQHGSLSLERPLYKHQEQAVRKLVNNRNLIVATGTGSGKTETFLIPILHHLLEEKRRGTLSKGVRALLLYPMNALANDQMKRLRAILQGCEFITFGRYTGDTKQKKEDAEKDFQENSKGEPRIKNELLSRAEMQAAPPHILLTNYAMLEYLLLRPDDSIFFDGEEARHWRFIVMDEVHTYDGAKGIETAMLLRRLKDRIAQSEQGRIQCIGTSATLGGGRKDFRDVARFGKQLFDEQFEWLEDDTNRQDVVEASRLMLKQDSVWGVPQPQFYQAAQDLLDSTAANIAKLSMLARACGVPHEVIEKAALSCNDAIQHFLYNLLSGDENLVRLRQLLRGDATQSNKPMLLKEATGAIFKADTNAEISLTALVNLAVQAKPEGEHAPLLPARYHLFAKALEGGFVAFGATKRLFLNRRKQTDDQEPFAVFEMATCKRCGAIHVVGVIEKDAKRLLQSQKISEDNYERAQFFLLKENPLDELDEDEEVAEPDSESEDQEEAHKLCVKCAAIDRVGAMKTLCACGRKWERTVIKISNEKGVATHCRSCGSRSPNLVMRFLTGQDAPASVLATALYQEIPEREVQQATANDEDDEYGQALDEVKLARRLLIFSDSRQNAAYFAPYLGDITYLPILWRRLIIRALQKHEREFIKGHWQVEDLIEPLRKEAQECGIFDTKISRRGQEREVWKWVMLELMAQDRRNSLEGLGLVQFSIAKPQNWLAGKTLQALLLPYNFSDAEVWQLFEILLNSFRLQGVILFPDQVSPDDEIFKPRNRAYYFRNQGAVKNKQVYSWSSPAKRRLNRRLDFVQKLLQQGATNEDIQELAKQILHQVWQNLTDSPFWKNHFSDTPIQGEGRAYQLRHDCWEIAPTFDASQNIWHECDTCGNLFNHNLRGVCPTYRCEGTLRSCNPEETKRDNHYRYLYLNLLPMRMICKEHTAQLTGDAASILQNQFIRGAVNVISCSTTFELGVDVGSLESVLMRNVPPSPANYIQRAGRAGRRTDSTAFALTFCQRRSHDLTYFQTPERMIAGTIRPPAFEVRNKKIIQRHIHSVALAMFWKEHKALFNKVKDFFFAVEGSEIKNREAFFATHPLREFLERKPPLLLEALKRILKEQHVDFKIESWEWLDEFFFSKDSPLQKAADELYGDVADMESYCKELIAEGSRDSLFRAIKIGDTIKTIQSKPIINFLSTRGVLPKYGFPVDVVELQLLHHGDEAKFLELQRDLRIALAEYAPESQVIAGGKLWTSYAIKKVPKREWRKFKYAICNHCNCYQRVAEATGKAIEVCQSCDQRIDGRNAKGTFIIPEFGFVSSRFQPPVQPTSARPERSYLTPQIFYTGEFFREEKNVTMTIGDLPIAAQALSDGRFAMLNRAGFQVCFHCGYAEREKLERKKKTPHKISHKTPQGKECLGALQHTDLGHEFQTDLLRLEIGDHRYSSDFWLSLLFALLEGASESLSVIRTDIDGCLYPYKGSSSPSLVLFDNVPGGAGHVRRLVEGEQPIKAMLLAARDKVNGKCGCKEDTSCYGCLQNYGNQRHHDDLKRGQVFNFLQSLPG
ncbi:MAG: DEAD/DEAH box helicase [Acidobacteria bacterium]|nr:DEAD/DEAH box helicase [Acidobacteriota bacterium]